MAIVLTKLKAHQAFYEAVANLECEPAAASAGGGLAALDAALASHQWKWAPSPTSFANWAEYSAAYKAWLARQSHDQAPDMPC